MKRMVFDLPASVNYNKDFIIETLVVADKTMTDFHGIEELKVYVPSLVNIVSLIIFSVEMIRLIILKEKTTGFNYDFGKIDIFSC